MRQHYITLLLALLCAGRSQAQITLQTQDIPAAGDSMFYSVASMPMFNSPGSEGADQTWDFTVLNAASQYVDKVSAVNQTNLVYVLFFGLPGNNFCNLAKTENNGPSLPSQTGLEFSDVYNFYRNTANAFVQKGFGASLNGIPIPVPFSSPEKIYTFPLTYDHRDTSDYTYEVSLPGIGYYGRKAHKTNHVDGWGTLKTAYGTFDVLRIRSVMQASDTIALDTIGRGLRIPLPEEVKYKWVAKNYGMPLLEMTTTKLPVVGFEIPSRIVYRDYKKIDTGVNPVEASTSQINIYPNPASDFVMIETERQKSGSMVYEIISADGRLVHRIERAKVVSGKAIEFISLAALQLDAGLYLVKVSEENGQNVIRPLIVNKP
ncbi:MAG: T9SS type A sorting domain-containing protein [Bacteroidia bacterium]|nr:T9SS type A sorting domain-containing protein [Bacteroidia bacterium]